MGSDLTRSDLDTLISMEMKLRLLDLENITIPEAPPPVPKEPSSYNFTYNYSWGVCICAILSGFSQCLDEISWGCMHQKKLLFFSFFSFKLLFWTLRLLSVSVYNAVCFIKQQKSVYTSWRSSQVRVQYRAVLLDLVQFQWINLNYLCCFQATLWFIFLMLCFFTAMINLFRKLRNIMCLVINGWQAVQIC